METITRAEAKRLGLTRYFTGEPCKHGHLVERTVCDHACVECGRLKSAKPETRFLRRGYMAAHQREYRAKHPDRIALYEQKRSKSERAATRRSSRANGNEKHRPVLRKSYKKHRAKRLAESRAWRGANPEANCRLQRVAKAKRRALDRSAEGSYTAQDIKRMHSKQNFICVTCTADISTNYHVDHIMPLSRGGANWPDNLQLLCAPCNRSKGAKTMEEWMAWLRP